MNTCRSALSLVEYEEFLFLQILQEPYVVRRNEQLCVIRIGLLGAKPAQNLSSDVYVKVTIDFVKDSRKPST